MSIFALLACLSLIWLILCVTGIVGSKQTSVHLAITIVAAVLLSLYVFGHGLEIGTTRIR